MMSMNQMDPKDEREDVNEQVPANQEADEADGVARFVPDGVSEHVTKDGPAGSDEEGEKQESGGD